MQINGNTVFIPGATSGIGLALAQRLQAEGNTVIIGGRRTELLQQLHDRHGFDTVRIDVTDPAGIRAAAQQVVRDHPALNVVVAMAGIMQVEDWTDPARFLDSAERVVLTNLLGPIRLIAAFTEHLQSRPDSTIVTVSSGLAFVPLKVTPSYNATKAAIHQLSETIRLQYAGTSVKVLELVPPSVQTDLMPGQAESAFAMPLDDFADEVVSLIEAQPDAKEILVKRVEFLRFAVARSDYDRTLVRLNHLDPHGE